MTIAECLTVAAMILGCLWCIAGDIECAKKIYPCDTIHWFRKKGSVWILDKSDICGSGRFKEKFDAALKGLVDGGFAVETETGWRLTRDGIVLWKCYCE